ncbi:MAG TPA: ABC transporter substrate-binding protein [Chloroflexota bacterium]|nr:ABC transporter substrate-binding protein [Chloroflexota bacterium]
MSAKPAASSATPASAAAKLAASGSAAPAASGLQHIKIGVVGITADAPLYIAQDQGYYKEQGLDAEFITFQTAGDSIPALSTGQIDAGSGAMSAAVFNAIARGANVRLVADKGQHSGSPINGFTSALVVAVPKGDSDKYKTFADMKGKNFGVTGTGGGQEVMLDKAMTSVGLSVKDINLKTMGFPEMAVALGNHSVDLAGVIEPFVAQGEAKNLLEVRWKSEELYEGQQGGMVMFGPNISQDVGNRFAVAYVKGLRDYYDAFGLKKKNTARMIDILAANTPVKDKTLYEKMGWDYYNPDGYINSKAVAYDLDWYAAHDYVKQKPDLSKVIDNSYVDYAISKLGKYGS